MKTAIMNMKQADYDYFKGSVALFRSCNKNFARKILKEGETPSFLIC